MKVPQISFLRWCWLLAGGLLCLSVISACRRSGPEKIIVSGGVTYGGQPVANGDIMFYPIAGTVGPVSGASIVDGQYRADGKGGVPLGRHRVEIRAYRGGAGSATSTNASSAFSAGRPTRDQYLPARFNDQSTLVTAIEGDTEPIVRDFQLTLQSGP